MKINQENSREKNSKEEKEVGLAALAFLLSLFPLFSFPPLSSSLLLYFHSFRRDMLLSPSLRITFGTAISKSSCVTWTRRSLRANIPVFFFFFFFLKQEREKSEFFCSSRPLDFF